MRGTWKGRLDKYLTKDNDGSTINMNANGGGDYIVVPASGEIYSVRRMIVFIEDSGNFTMSGYGAIGSGTITNGIRVAVIKNGVKTYLDGGVPIIANGHWARMCHDLNYISFGSGNNAASVRWMFTRDAHGPDGPQTLREGGIVLDGQTGDKSQLELGSDDWSGLVNHNCILRGDAFYSE